MAISFVAAGSVGTGNQPIAGIPAGVVAGDLLVIVTAGATPSIDANFYTGWTRIANQGAGQFIGVFTKIAEGNDAFVQLSIGSPTGRAVMLAYRGCGWYDVVASFTTATATSIATATQTTGFANDYVTSIYAVTNQTRTWTAPASTTTRVNAAGTTSFRGLLVVDELQAAAGVTTARTATVSSSSTLSAVSISIREPQTCYWVGGPGTWSSTSKTNWATSSGGTAGTIVPGYDNVVFDANSNVGTTGFDVTLSTTDWARCNNFTTSSLDANMNLAGGTSSIYAWIAYGDVTFPATNLSFSGTSGDLFLTPVGSKTLITNGINVGYFLTKEGTGTTTLGSALTTTKTFKLVNGTFSTSASNYAFSISSGSFQYIPDNGATLSLNGSTLTIAGSWDLGSGTNLTFNPGTSLISLTSNGGTFTGNGLTYYDVNIQPSNAPASSTILGNNTFRNLTVTSYFNKSNLVLPQGSTQTVTGTFAANGADNRTRIFITISGVPLVTGAVTPATISAANRSLSNVDFYGITAAGGGSWSGTSIGNVGLNTNITFTAAKTVFLPSAANGNLDTTSWATSSGGSGNVANYPLPQDTATITNNSGGDGTEFTSTNNVWYPLIDGSTRTTSGIFAFESDGYYTGGLKLGSGFNLLPQGGAVSIGGDFSLASGVTYDNDRTILTSLTFIPTRSTTQTITTGGLDLNSLSQVINFSGNINSSTIAISGNLSADNRTATFANTNLDLSAGGITVQTFTSTSTNTKSITFGTNSITTKGGGTAINVVGTGLTITGTGGFNLNNLGSSATTATLSTGFTQSNAPNLTVTGGTYALTLTAPILNSLSFSSFTGTVNNIARTIYGSFTISGTNPSFTAGTAVTTFAGSGSKTITTNGVTLDFPITLAGIGGSWQLGSALSMGSTRTLTLTDGTFNAVTYNVTTGLFSSNNNNTRTLSMGSGLWTLTGTGSIWNIGGTLGLTFNKGTANILTTAGAGTLNFGVSGAVGRTYNKLTIGGTISGGLSVQFQNGNTFSELTNTRLGALTLAFAAGTTTTVTDFTVTGASGFLGETTLSRIGASGTWNIAKAGGGIVENIDELIISNSTATPGGTWYAGANSENNGGNTGWIFGIYPGPSNGNFFLLF
jgi:hypothetical protein